MKKKCLNIVAFVFLTLLSCEKKHAIIPNTFEYKWYSLNGNLTIKSNNTFEYSRSACVSHSISKGKWKINNDTLVLNSFEPKGCYYIESFILKPPPPPKDTIAKDNYKIKEIIKDCIPNIGYIIFTNEKFYIKDSLLVSKSFPYLYDGSTKLNNLYNFQKTAYYKYN
ncbi:hypothetical protein [Flavobacterium sp. PL002]|uniref:hypothetical protein n=1 Tax=Flavobacterium sp. PL002 TaxID=1897058 RepID=UPI0017889AB6|nr:hypothetical protein [Flavobacterium sp. PL002]MBE0393373.1 hypothetical protein [Flavobacterium sp. PL002]